MNATNTPYAPGSIQHAALAKIRGKNEVSISAHHLQHGPSNNLEDAEFLDWGYNGDSYSSILKLVLGEVHPNSSEQEAALKQLLNLSNEYLDQVDPRWSQFDASNVHGELFGEWETMLAEVQEPLSVSAQKLVSTLNSNDNSLSRDKPTRILAYPVSTLIEQGENGELASPRAVAKKLLNRGVREDVHSFLLTLILRLRENGREFFAEDNQPFSPEVDAVINGFTPTERSWIKSTIHHVARDPEKKSSFIDHFSTLSWASMIEVAQLAEQYNWEWVWASFEW